MCGQTLGCLKIVWEERRNKLINKIDIWPFLLKTHVDDLPCMDAQNSEPTGTLGEFSHLVLVIGS